MPEWEMCLHQNIQHGPDDRREQWNIRWEEGKVGNNKQNVGKRLNLLKRVSKCCRLEVNFLLIWLWWQRKSRQWRVKSLKCSRGRNVLWFRPTSLVQWLELHVRSRPSVFYYMDYYYILLHLENQAGPTRDRRHTNQLLPIELFEFMPHASF